MRAGNAGGDDTGRRNATLLLAEIEQGEMELRRHYHGAMEANPGRRKPPRDVPKAFPAMGGDRGGCRASRTAPFGRAKMNVIRDIHNL